MQYLPHYDRHTGIPKGSYPTANDVLTRSQMIRDAGLNCIGETWDPGNGNVPIYEGPILSSVDMQTLCLKEYIDQDEKNRRELLAKYKLEFKRVNGNEPYIVLDGNHHLEINGSRFLMTKLPEFIVRLEMMPDFEGQVF